MRVVYVVEVNERMDAEEQRVDILIVEDSATQSEKLKYWLEKNNYNVLTASNGRVALELIDTRKPAIVITDIMMPEMDGLQLCRTIKTDERSGNIPIILLTALSDPQDVLKGLECGADNFITKPYDEQYLLAAIRHAVDNRAIRTKSKLQSEGAILFRGQKYFITSERYQILDFLISTYETAIMENQELRTVREQLEALNEGLEKKVELRTAALVAEIEERKKAEEQVRRLNEELEHRVKQRTMELESANRELEAFSYSVSHDLRAPLRHMSGFVDLLTKRLENNPDGKTLQYAAKIAVASNTMAKLIDDLLDFSRVGRNEMQKSRVNLNFIIKEVVQEIRDELKERKIRFEIDELPDVLGDQSLLRLMIVNLVSNAVKFTSTRPQAEIRIGCEDEGDKFTCSISDNGVGFDMKHADKLFGVFQRLHTQEEFEGTGIGLANVQRIISRHGGRIWAEGAVGQGATFYFTLPKTTE